MQLRPAATDVARAKLHLRPTNMGCTVECDCVRDCCLSNFGPCSRPQTASPTTSCHGRLQFKTLDQVLQTINSQTGVKEAISYRCVDIDRHVPQLMGVSKVHVAAFLPLRCRHNSARNQW